MCRQVSAQNWIGGLDQMAGLTLKNIYKKYPGGVVAVSDVNLEIRDE